MGTELQKIATIGINQDSRQRFVETSDETIDIDEYVNIQLTLSAGVIDYPIIIDPALLARVIYIKTTQPIYIKLNDPTAARYIIVDAWLLGTNNVTVFFLSNASSIDAKVRIIISNRIFGSGHGLVPVALVAWP